MAARETKDDEWGPAVYLGSTLNGPMSESYPSISIDGLELFYTAPFWQSGWTQFGGADLWVSRRSSVSGDWGAPENLGSVVNTSYHDTEPSISADGLELYFCSNRPGGSDEWTVWVTTRKKKDDPWEEPVDLGLGDAGTPNILADGLVLVFSSSRPGGYGEGDIWMTRRKTKDEPWQEPINLGPPVSDSGRQWAPCISNDGSTLYFTDWDKSPNYGYFDIWQAPIIPIVDLNGDRIVDSADMCIMIDHWGTDNSLCDIGPMPWGDGIVDVQDLIVLAEHLFEEFPPAE
jgi:Tol biopolymer transport system component